MASQRLKEMVSAASDVVIQNYLQSYEYKRYILIKEGNKDGLTSLTENMEDDSNGIKSQLEIGLEIIKKDFEKYHTYITETEELISGNGFEEYFLREDIKEKVMAGVIESLLVHPEERHSTSSFFELGDNTLKFAFDYGIRKVLTDDQRTILKNLTKKYKPLRGDPTLPSFVLEPFNDFVKNLYAGEYQAKGRLL